MNRTRLLTVVMLVAALTLSGTVQLKSIYAAPPVAKILSIDYPREVLPVTVFKVSMVAEYSDKVGIDIGIWDVENGTVVQSVSIPLSELGPINFTFNLTAPDRNGDWHLLAITRIWWLNAWYQDPIDGAKAFTVNISSIVTVTLASSATPLAISLDETTYNLSDSRPLSLQLTPGIHRLYAPTLLEPKAGERFVFSSWSDESSSNPRLILITHSVNLTAIYRTEYHLSIRSERGRTIGEGWYPAGSNVTFAAIPIASNLSSFGLGGYEFDGWSGDSRSREPIASLVMDGPKNVDAQWVPSRTTLWFVFLSVALLLGSLLVITVGIYRKIGARISRTPSRRSLRLVKLIVVSVALVALMVQVPSTHAQLPLQPGRTSVTIGDASWYYWNNTASDACLIWLGGGTTQEQEVGHYSYMINPLEYESFGTLRFLQDLTRYYCLIALQKGSSEYFSLDSNRTIFQEPYTMDSRILSDIHAWLKSQGYAHTFLVGYSTGAQVAAMEMALRAPEEWISPDGLILITPRLSDIVSRSAHQIRASLMVVYGGSIETPAYISTGHEFFLDAPASAWYGPSYLYKEFQVIGSMGHEVWTKYETGVYDTQALRIVVDFVNSVEALQFTAKEAAMIVDATGNLSAPIAPSFNLISVNTPSQISRPSLLSLDVLYAFSNSESVTAQVVALNNQDGNIEDAKEFMLAGSGRRIVHFELIPPSNSTELPLGIIILTKTNDGWHVASKPVFTQAKITNSIKVTFASTYPDIPLTFDGVEVRIPENGSLSLETEPGLHTLHVEPVTYLSSQTRILFASWPDGRNDSSHEFRIDSDTTLYLSYRLQYFLNVTSQYGNTTGSGWYDSNSTAIAFVQPPVMSDTGVAFSQWEPNVNSTDIRVLLNVNAPTTVTAQWASLSNKGPTEDTGILVLCSILFLVTFLWYVKTMKNHR